MIVANGSADITTYIALRDSTTHELKTGVDVNTLDLYYVEQGAAISSKVDATALAAANTAHTDNYAYEIGQGIYRVDWPDAAFDGGVGKRVILVVVTPGCDTVFIEVELSPAVDLHDAAIAELTTDPGATPTFKKLLMLLYMHLRNAGTATASARTVKNNAGTTVLTATMSDNGTTFDQGKLG